MASPEVDWDWYNKLPSHAIHGLVALSLGLDPDRCRPLGTPGAETAGLKGLPPEFDERSALTYSCARAGLTYVAEGDSPTHDPGRACGLNLNLSFDISGQPFNPKADVRSGQYWEITILSFRQFCDRLGLKVPHEFRPMGYSPIFDAGGVGASRKHGNDTKGKRTTVLSPVIEDAITDCESDEIARVWAKLEEWAGLQRAPFVGVVKGKGLKYMDTGEKIYSRGALRAHLHRRAEALAAAR